jgi:hypothetical protein
VSEVILRLDQEKYKEGEAFHFIGPDVEEAIL